MRMISFLKIQVLMITELKKNNMNEKTVNIDNFIGVYDNYITKDDCDKAIRL